MKPEMRKGPSAESTDDGESGYANPNFICAAGAAEWR